VILAVAAAVGAAVAYAVSTIMQAIATRRSHGLGAVRHPLVIGGLALDGVAWVLSLLALDRLPLFVVQAVVASSLVAVVVLARVVLRATLRHADLLAISGVVTALVVLTVAAGEQPASEPPAGFTIATVVVAFALLLGVAVSLRRGHPVVLALLAGLGYSVAAIAARGAHAADDLLDTVLQPLALAVVAAGAAAVLAYLRALEKGSVGPVAATVSVIEVLVPGAVGLIVLGDTVRDGWAVPASIAVFVAVAGCAALATSPANTTAEEQRPAAAGDAPGTTDVRS
jgi:drug/metabolite transporter (DMT)-like permease